MLLAVASALAGSWECIAVPMHGTGDVYPAKVDAYQATALPSGWRPIGAVVVPSMLGGSVPAVIACRGVGDVSSADVDEAASAQARAEAAAGVGPSADTASTPASAYLLARQLYEATGRAVPADLAADAAAVWARIQAGTDLQAVRAAATKGAALVPAGSNLDAILTAGGLPGTLR